MLQSKLVKTIILILLVGGLVLLLQQNRKYAEKIHELSLQLDQSAPEQDPAAAQRIIEEVRGLITIPEGIEPTVATIVDVEALRARNPFYNSAENGDHLIVTPTRAILYDPDAKQILDVVPVQITPAGAEPAEG